MFRHKTLKKNNLNSPDESTQDDNLRNLLEAGVRDAYNRPWHRLERGLRLNRIRLFIEEQYTELSKENKDELFLYLQKSLDKKLLNTLKIVHYDIEKQRITNIVGLDIKYNNNDFKYTLSAKKIKSDVTRKKKKEDAL